MDHAWGGMEQPSCNSAAASELNTDAEATTAPLAIEDGEVSDGDANGDTNDDKESDVPTTQPEQTQDDDYPEAPEVDIKPRHLESLFEEVAAPEDSQAYDIPEVDILSSTQADQAASQVEMLSDTPTDWGDLGSAGWPDKSEIPDAADSMPPPPPPCPERKKRRNEVVEEIQRLRLGRPNSASNFNHQIFLHYHSFYSTTKLDIPARPTVNDVPHLQHMTQDQVLGSFLLLLVLLWCCCLLVPPKMFNIWISHREEVNKKAKNLDRGNSSADLQGSLDSGHQMHFSFEFLKPPLV